MISQENADKVSEFSLTDKRHSRITRFMATTLFDENMGGAFGNIHIALGNAYKDTYNAYIAAITEEEWAAMGYNSCPKVHTDIISTTNRRVTATLKDGSKRLIYQNGQSDLQECELHDVMWFDFRYTSFIIIYKGNLNIIR